jgi:RNA polymerase sigma-70 factor (ECF subfamily)
MIERFVEDYADKAFVFAYSLCGNAEEAKELVQESFYRLIKGWEQYDQAQPLENWYLTILRNLYFDSQKRYERHHQVSLDVPAGGPQAMDYAESLPDEAELTIVERLEKLEDTRAVQRALASLSREHRAILTMTDLQGMTYERAAEVLDCPLGTIRSRMNRARRALKKALVAELGTEVVER